MHIPRCHAAAAGRGAVLSCISLQGCWHMAPCPLVDMRNISGPAKSIGGCIGMFLFKSVEKIANLKKKKRKNQNTSQMLDFYPVTNPPRQHREQRVRNLSWTKGKHPPLTDDSLWHQTTMWLADTDSSSCVNQNVLHGTPEWKEEVPHLLGPDSRRHPRVLLQRTPRIVIRGGAPLEAQRQLPHLPPNARLHLQAPWCRTLQVHGTRALRREEGRWF